MKVLVIYYGCDKSIEIMTKTEIKKLKKDCKGVQIYKLGRKL